MNFFLGIFPCMNFFLFFSPPPPPSPQRFSNGPSPRMSPFHTGVLLKGVLALEKIEIYSRTRNNNDEVHRKPRIDSSALPVFVTHLIFLFRSIRKGSQNAEILKLPENTFIDYFLCAV